MTTINERAFFGIYADSQTLPDADLLAADVDESVEVLISSANDQSNARSGARPERIASSCAVRRRGNKGSASRFALE
jgi:hypothetical protein